MPNREDILKLLGGDEFEYEQEIVRMGRAAVPHLLDLLEEASEPLIKSQIILVLGAIGDQTATTAIEAILNDQDPVMRLTAAEALTRLLGSEATPALIALLDDPDPGVCNIAMQSLARVGTEVALDSLERVKNESPHEALIVVAENAIQDINQRNA